jgi:hypothetical protein
MITKRLEDGKMRELRNRVVNEVQESQDRHSINTSTMKMNERLFMKLHGIGGYSLPAVLETTFSVFRV